MPLIKGIINKAREIKGSVLQLDIIQAEQYLAYRKLAIKSCSYIQVSIYIYMYYYFCYCYYCYYFNAVTLIAVIL